VFQFKLIMKIIIQNNHKISELETILKGNKTARKINLVFIKEKASKIFLKKFLKLIYIIKKLIKMKYY